MSADSPITLDEACKLYPGARYKVSTLRADAAKLAAGLKIAVEAFSKPADPVQPDMEG